MLVQDSGEHPNTVLHTSLLVTSKPSEITSEASGSTGSSSIPNRSLPASMNRTGRRRYANIENPSAPDGTTDLASIGVLKKPHWLCSQWSIHPGGAEAIQWLTLQICDTALEADHSFGTSELLEK